MRGSLSAGVLAACIIAVPVECEGQDASLPLVKFEKAGVSVEESSGTVEIKVLRVGDISATSAVKYFTVSDTAKAPEDYQHVAPTILTFAANESAKTVSVQVKNNDNSDGDRAFFLVLREPTGARVPGEPEVDGEPSEPTVKVTIRDEETGVLGRFFTYLGSESLHLRRRSDLRIANNTALDFDLSSDGARGIYTHNAGGEDVWAFDGVLAWQPTFYEAPDSKPGLRWADAVIALEAHVGSDDQQTERGVNARGGANLVFALHEKIFLPLTVTAAYEADQRFKDQRAGLELWFTLESSCIPGMAEPVPRRRGKYRNWPFDEYLSIRFRWRYQLGGAVHVPIRQADDNANDNVISRLQGAVRGTLEFKPFPSKRTWDGIRLVLYAEVRAFLVEAREDPADGGRQFYEAGADLFLTENLAIGVGYRKGRNAPNFTNRVEQTFVSASLKF